MAVARTSIEWTDATWSPIIGCSRVSRGCENCYAERLAIRQKGGRYAGLVKSTRRGPRWTGAVSFVPEALDQPLRWRTPRRIFVNSMSDLFHERVTNEQIAAIFGVMNAAKDRHVFQVLTKRPERMRAWFNWIDESPCAVPGLENECRVLRCFGEAQKLGVLDYSRWWGSIWPLPNVWLGVSIEDQATADARIPILLQTAAAVRWVSYEPALAAADFKDWLPPHVGHRSEHFAEGTSGPALSWLVVGGESGAGARPFDLAWARQTIAQGKAAGVPVFVKQLGARPVYDVQMTGEPETVHRNDLRLRDRKGGDPAEWPEDLRVREWPA
jgi:protein gp37